MLTNTQTGTGKHQVPFSLKGIPHINRYVERNEEMQKLRRFFYPATPSLVHRRAYVLHGMGGIGKAQLAVAFAQKYHRKHSAVFWLDESSRDRLEQGLVDTATRLPQDEITADIAESHKQEKVGTKAVIYGVTQ